MSFVLNSVTLPDPTSYKKDITVGGDYNTTMGGGIRRNIKYKKEVHTLNWSILPSTDYDAIMTIYDLDTTVTFVNSDLSISMTVHVDVDNREVIAGVDGYMSSFGIVLTEV
jgi:hypothetical protein